ncbi:hypothetical protein ElyMa_003423000 [Elysia marginata]|uniref:Uncharacterized protein n=1 Tax=Elysia marginata TaxID=1093978 RepID=A0AAV4JPL3_9GAST|nr:hypothetical protein ElyMa_003423000 [Elysia marginata]
MEMGQGGGFASLSSKPISSVFSSSSSSSRPAASASPAAPSSSSLSSCVRWQATVPTVCERSKVVVSRRPESLAVLPLTWDIAVTIYQELVRLVHRLPFHKRLVVCLVYRGAKFRLDLGEGEYILCFILHGPN